MPDHRIIQGITGTTVGIDPAAWGTVRMRVLVCRGCQRWRREPGQVLRGRRSLGIVGALVVGRRAPAVNINKQHSLRHLRC